MKPIFTLILTLAVIQSNCQADTSTYSMVIVAPVLLGGEASLYSQQTGYDNSIRLLTDKLTLYLMVPGNPFTVDDMFRFGETLPLQAWQTLEYRMSLNNQKAGWLGLPGMDRTSITRYKIADQLLRQGEQLTVEIRRMPEDSILQITTFLRVNWQPAIDAWRQYRHGSNEEEKYSGYLLQSAVDRGELLPANISYLQLQPGRETDILWHDEQLNRDSGWEYKLANASDTADAPWQRAGRLLHLAPLPGNSHYILTARFRGQQTIGEYHIITTAYWYQNPFLLVIICIVTGMVIVGLILYRQRRRNRVAQYQKKKLENQLLLVHNQLNPHFIRNSFNSINSLLSSGETERAARYLTVFSEMMHHTMSVSQKPVISLASDLDQMSEYLRIEQLRFGFCFQFNIAADIDLNTIELPPQLLQPSFENAVRHGAASLYEAGMVRLDIIAAGQDLLINISNNRSETPSGKKEGGGYGLKLTRQQISNLRQLYKERRISFELERLPDGAIAHFFFENWLKPE